MKAPKKAPSLIDTTALVKFWKSGPYLQVAREVAFGQLIDRIYTTRTDIPSRLRMTEAEMDRLSERIAGKLSDAWREKFTLYQEAFEKHIGAANQAAFLVGVAAGAGAFNGDCKVFPFRAAAVDRTLTRVYSMPEGLSAELTMAAETAAERFQGGGK